MDVREKLVEILRKPIFPHELVDPIEAVADYLLDSGVTIQKWIPVSERLPEEFVSVLVCIPSENPLPTVKEAYLANGAWATKMAIFFMEEVTHWMPLPDAPKGE